MRKTLPEQIASNKRASVIFAFLLVLLLGALGTVIVGVWQPRAWYYGTAGALILGIIVAIVARTSGSKIVLSISGAREATQAEDQMLNNVVEEMSLAAGIPKPKIYVIDDPSPNAFATGPDPEHAVVAVTTGLMQKLNRDELQGVIAHELGHVRNYDIRFMTTVALIAGLIPLLADLFIRMQWFGGGRRDSRDKNNGLAAIFMVVGLLLAILAPLCSVLIEMAVSRKREYLADATSAELTRYPEGLASALRKISSDTGKLHVANRATQHMYIVNPLQLHGGDGLFSTHPSTENRIKALLGNMGSGTKPPIEA